MFNPNKPYNDLPFLPPSAQIESLNILRSSIEANKKLAQMKMAARLIPNETVLINSIPLLESQASSAIENILTTTDELFEYADSRSPFMTSAARETLRYRQALYAGYQSLQKRSLSIATICEICSTIREVETSVRKIPGTTLINDKTHQKIYTPPEGEGLLRDLLTNWQNYLHEKDEVDPLIKLAVQHYQFEAIHPFSDGNGRTGRIINLLYLIEQGLLDTPILYLSGYIIQNKTEYYEKLDKVTIEEAWEDWILYFLSAVRETAEWSTYKILAIQELIEDSCELIKHLAPSIYTRELVELLFVQPYVRISHLIESNIAQRETASKYLKILAEIGFLEEVKRGREKFFINHRFLSLLKQNMMTK